MDALCAYGSDEEDDVEAQETAPGDLSEKRGTVQLIAPEDKKPAVNTHAQPPPQAPGVGRAAAQLALPPPGKRPGLGSLFGALPPPKNPSAGLVGAGEGQGDGEGSGSVGGHRAAAVKKVGPMPPPEGEDDDDDDAKDSLDQWDSLDPSRSRQAGTAGPVPVPSLFSSLPAPGARSAQVDGSERPAGLGGLLSALPKPKSKGAQADLLVAGQGPSGSGPKKGPQGPLQRGPSAPEEDQVKGKKRLVSFHVPVNMMLLEGSESDDDDEKSTAGGKKAKKPGKGLDSSALEAGRPKSGLAALLPAPKSTQSLGSGHALGAGDAEGWGSAGGGGTRLALDLGDDDEDVVANADLDSGLESGAGALASSGHGRVAGRSARAKAEGIPEKLAKEHTSNEAFRLAEPAHLNGAPHAHQPPQAYHHPYPQAHPPQPDASAHYGAAAPAAAHEQYSWGHGASGATAQGYGAEQWHGQGQGQGQAGYAEHHAQGYHGGDPAYAQQQGQGYSGGDPAYGQYQVQGYSGSDPGYSAGAYMAEPGVEGQGYAAGGSSMGQWLGEQRGGGGKGRPRWEMEAAAAAAAGPGVVEVRQADLTKNRPRKDQLRTTGIALGPAYVPVSSTKDKPDKMARRKHQIGSLFFDMKQKEMEMAERRSKGMLTKAETHAKYGWS